MKPIKLNINTKLENYSIIIGSNIIKDLATYFKKNSIIFDKCLLIIDSKVPGKMISKVTKSLNGKKISKFIFNANEKNKNLNNINKILQILLNKNFSRQDCIIAIGGGITGDVGGFVASLYKRGLQFINLPTTLLSQVDSSVGGKTAINIKQGKNLIGSFNNPSLVLISSKFIETLSEEEFNSGLGEVIKYAFIGNKKLYKLLKDNSESIKHRQLKILEEIIEESIKTKAKIVTEDEKESGIRAILNFGHTFGHAVEAFNKYKNITHGEAVIIGMVIATKISFHEGHIKNYQLDNVINLIDSLGLNSEYKKYKYKDLKQFILNDKKVSQGKLNLILINSSGKAFKTDKFNQQNLKKAFN